MPILEPHHFELQTLTPIWTGGPQQICGPRMFETGIIGSLRWWLEACARTRVTIPDPVADRIQYKLAAPLDLDPVSRIFGATGWRRRFRLSIVSPKLESIPIPPQLAVKSGRHLNPRWKPPKPNGPPNKQEQYIDESTYYYNGGEAWFGAFTIRIQPTAPWLEDYDRLSIELLRDLLALVAQYGMLGAKPQLGLGVVRLLSPAPVAGFPALREWVSSRDYEKIEARNSLPSLSDMLFGEMDAPADSENNLKSYWRSTFTLKPEIRKQFKAQDLRHRICGEIPARSKILISHPYLDVRDSPRQRYCAWLPDGLGDEKNGSGTVRDTITKFFGTEPPTDGSTILS